MAEKGAILHIHRPPAQRQVRAEPAFAGPNGKVRSLPGFGPESEIDARASPGFPEWRFVGFLTLTAALKR